MRRSAPRTPRTSRHWRIRAALLAVLVLAVGHGLPLDAALARPLVRMIDEGATPPPATDAPSDPAPADPAPSDPRPDPDPTPGEPDPTEPHPSDPGATDPAPTDPGATDPAPAEPGDPGDPAPAEPDPTAPAEPGPTEPETDLGAIDFVDRGDLDRVRHDPGETARLVELAQSQLTTIDRALREAKERVDRTGEAYDTALREADEARELVEELEDEAEGLRDQVVLSDTTIALMVQRMRLGTYAVPPEIAVLLEGDSDSDLLYQYGLLSGLASEEALAGESARSTAVEVDRLLERAEIASERADELARTAERERDAAVLAQHHLEQQIGVAEQHRGELALLLADLGIEAGGGELAGLVATRHALLAAAPGTVNALGWAAPITAGSVTSHYGYRVHPVEGSYRMHYGTDFVSPGGTCGATLYAVGAGTVTYAGWLGTYGNHLEIRLDSGDVVSYSHIVDGGIGVGVGARVVAGQPIALAGTTGASTGCHLHFEVKVGGADVEPLAWLAARGW